MLIAARDIVQRLPGADEQRIRVELSGNLCRCTGYLGIVNAVRSVAAAPRAEALGETAAASPAPHASGFKPFVPAAKAVAAAAQASPIAEDAAARKGWTRFEESFVIDQPPARVWAIFADVPAVAACLPGADLTDHDAHNAKGRMSVRLGPILAAFAGSAAIERDDAALCGIIRGAGSDRGTGSRTKGEVTYRLAAEGDGQTRVSIVVEYSLQGALAQFSRSSLAQDLGRRLVAEFAANLNARLSGGAAPRAHAGALNIGQLIWAWLRERLLGRSSS
jgi:carbon-monoxide dehydrogenase small subunit